MRIFFLVLGAFLFLMSSPIPAADNAPSFGLAMNGTPKYTARDTHVSYARPHAPKGGTLTMAAIGTFDTVNPYPIKGKAAEGLNLVYDRLMARVWDEPFTMYPLIAERYSIAPDRSSITFYLNPKARFQDASPITADDVLFSFETLRDFGRPNMRRVYKLVKTAQQTKDGGIQFSLGDGYDQETIMIIAMMPVLSKAYWQNRNFDSTMLDPVLGNGPYRIAKIDAGRKIIYERNPDYWAKDLLPNAGHYNFDRIVYEYYRDDTVAFEAFKSGASDLRREFDAGKWASAYDFPAIKDGRVIAEELPHQRPERARGFIFNTRRAPFDDIRVREAFDLLFDFEWLNKTLYHGRFRRSASMFPNSELAHHGKPDAREISILSPWKDNISADIFAAPYRPTQNDMPEKIRENMRAADALLKEAGWIIKKGKRVQKNTGKPLSFEIILEAPEDEKIALHFRRALKKMGIDMRIRVMDSAAYRGRMNEYDFDMTIYHWLSSLSPGTEQVLYWGCKAADEPGRWNYAGICDPAIDKIAADIPLAKTRADMVARIHALDRLLMHGHYTIPLYYVGMDYVAHQSHIKRPDETPLYGMVTETWWMERPAPKKNN